MSYIDMKREVDSWANKKSYARLLKPAQRGDETMSVAHTNAIIWQDYNMVSVLAGILQNPFFTQDYPKYFVHFTQNFQSLQLRRRWYGYWT